MAGGEARVRAGRSATIAVTGAAGDLGRPLAGRLTQHEAVKRVVGVDTARASLPGVTWRRADVRDPTLRTKFSGVETVVHLATDRRSADQAVDRRAVNVRGTDVVLEAAAAAGVRRVVLLTSAMVYGAHPTNPVPLPEDAPLRVEPDLTLVGDWLEMERLATRATRSHPEMQVVVVRPASLVGAVVDPVLPRMFEAPRLLSIKDHETRWQFCHTDDLVTALEAVALGALDGPVTVGCDGWLAHEDVERISGLRSVVVPPGVAFTTADRLQRIGVIPAPASELQYVAHPWVVGSQRLRAVGWTPAWDNAAALTAHLDALGDRVGRLGRGPRRDATRAAAGATVALVGTLAIARARAARRRRHG